MRQRIAQIVLGVLISVTAAAQLPAMKDSTNGVTIGVTPGNLAADAKVWDFAIVLDTHSQDLSDDLAKSAVLVDDRGNQSKPLKWEGSAPGGHHRAGALKFGAIAPRPKAIELRISRRGETQARIFRWELK